MKLRLALLLFFTFWVVTSYGQYQQEKYGQNRVQYKEFDWLYYGTDNYDVHYYTLGDEYAKVALDVLDTEFEKLTDLIGYSPFAKTKIFIYNSTIDLMQSNIGVGQPVFTIAGETKFVKLQLEVAYPGSIIEFRKELKYKLAHTLLSDMMFGGSLADVFQSSYLLNLPEWFTEGAARFVAYGWDIEMDDYLRDFLSKVEDKRIKNFSRLEDEEAALVGQSVWNYIAVRYGNSNLSNILNLTRIIRDEEASIASSLGISYEQFRYEWAEYYGHPLAAINTNYIAPEKDDRIVRTLKEDAVLTKLKISPDGTKIAYVQNFNGKYKIIIRDLESNKERVAYKGGYHIIDQEISYHLPLIDWITDTELGIVEAWNGRNFLVTYHLENRTITKKSLVRFNQINNISFNDNGKLAILSADIKGQTDLYLLSMKRNAVKRLTKDPWDDLYPEFIPGTDAIVFSSNRTNESIGYTPSESSKTPDVLNLFAYDLDTTTTRLFRLTNTLSNDIKPVPFGKDTIYYISDLKGINNMYRFSFRDSTFTQVTNFRTSLQDYDINQYTNDLSFLMLNKGKSKIYLNQQYDLGRTVFTPPTLRHQVKQLEYIREQREARNPDLEDEEDDEWSFLGADSVVNVEDDIGFGAYEFILDDYKALLDTANQQEESEFIDLDNYQFDVTATQKLEDQNSISAQFDNPLSFLFGDEILQRKDSLASDSVGIRDLEYDNPMNLMFEQELNAIQSGDRDSLEQIGLLYRHPDEFQFEQDSTQYADTEDINYRHPFGYQFEDQEEPQSDSATVSSEFIDLENYKFGDIQERRTEGFLSDFRQKKGQDFLGSGRGNFAVDTTLAQAPKGDFIDTDDYQFEDEGEAAEEEDIFSFLSVYLQIQKEPTVTGPQPFETSFMVDNVVTNFVIDPYRGFGVLMETQMSDVLENHKFNGGFLAISDFQSGDFFAQYRFLKYTIDLKARYDRSTIFKEGQEPLTIDTSLPLSTYRQKYKKNTFTLGAALPINASTRFEVDGFMLFTDFYNLHEHVLAITEPLNPPLIAIESHYTYTGMRAAWVFDNTLTHGLNLFEGTRGKIMFEHFQNLTDNSRSFSNINVDLRRYQKIHRELIVASRFYYGRSVGNRPKKYMLGGMDNWFAHDRGFGFRTDNTNQLETPLSFSNFKDNTDVLFSEFVNLRGFDYNRLSGSNVMTFTSELRWPVFKYFTRGAIPSDFARNFQIIGFYDVGSAWTGISPFSEENDVDRRVVQISEQSPFKATIKTSRTPWFASYGFGIRTVMMGYYTRLDVAKPIEDYRVGPTRWYITIGYDF